MSLTTRRALLCALPALPFVVAAFGQPSPQPVQVRVTGRVFDNKEFVDHLIEEITRAIDDRDVTLSRQLKK